MQDVKDLLSDLLNAITDEVDFDKSDTDNNLNLFKSELKFNDEISVLASKYKYTPFDVINNVSGTIFSNYCLDNKNVKGFNTSEKIVGFQRYAAIILENIEKILGEQTFEEKLLILIVVIRMLNIKSLQKIKLSEEKVKKEHLEEIEKAKHCDSEHKCTCKDKEKITSTNKVVKNEEEVIKLLNKIFDLIE